MIRENTSFVLRRWRRNPVPASVALVTLALGIGITTVALSLVRAVLLRPLPFADPGRLVRVTALDNSAGERETWPVSYPDFLDWRERSRTFADLSVFTDDLSLKIEGPEGAELIDGEMVSANYFRLLGVAPQLGRMFLPEEDRKPGAGSVVVLGHELWRQRLQGDPAALGKALVLNEIPYTIVGVMPPGFKGLSDKAQVWLPISMATAIQPAALESRKYRWLSVVGRLRPEQTADSAGRELQGVAAQLGKEYPDTNKDIGVLIEPLASAWFGQARPVLLLLLAGSVLVLLIAYCNVSNLWLADIMARRGEICVRTVLGADRRRLVYQLLAEAVLLTLAGFVLGMGAAVLGVRSLVQTAGLSFRSFVDVGVDFFVLGVILGLALVCGLLFGTIPALLGTRSDLGAILRAEAATAAPGRRRLQSLLVVYEIALTTVLILGTGLMISDLRRVVRTDLGFRADHLLTFRTMTQGERYSENEQLWSMILDATSRLGSLPGVQAVAIAGPAIPTDTWHGFHVTVEDLRDSDPDQGLLLLRHHVTPGYFRMLGVPILKGRDFTLGDRKGTLPVVLISDAAARRLWPGDSPLGKRIKLGERDSKQPWMTVVGVSGSIRHEGRGGEERPGPDFYMPLLQAVSRHPPVLNLLVRTSVPPATLAPVVVREFRKLAPGLPPYDVKTMEERLAGQTAGKRFFTGLMIASALVALLLSVVGVYGVISCVVEQRNRELGVRMALGATAADLRGLLVRQGLRLALAGILSGLLAALAFRGLAGSLLIGLGSLSPTLLAGASLLLVGLVAITCYVPVHRALRAQSLTALTRGMWTG